MVASLSSELDWPWLLDMADRHHVLPLVAHTLRTHCSEVMPAWLIEHLRVYALAVGLRNAYMTRELLALLDVFQRAGVSALPFKGPVLAWSVYGDISLRQFSDLDVLIRACDVEHAKNLLVDRGYRLDPPLNARQRMYLRGLTGQRENTYLRSRSEHHFVRATDNVTVDLHLALADPYIRFSMSARNLLRRSEEVKLQDVPVRTLSSEDTLLMLCLNGAKDGWARLQRTCDVAAVLQARPAIDHNLVLARAREVGAARMLRVSLLLARDLTAAHLPEPLERDLAGDAAARSIAQQVCLHLFDRREHRPELSLAYARSYVRTRERIRDRLWFYLHLALTPGVSDWSVVSLPSSLSVLYYLMRPLRLVWDYSISNRLRPRTMSSKSRPVSSR
jgi:hypothetical protein